VEEVKEVEKWKEWKNKWERFWFEEAPSDIFALVRIAVGAAGLIDLIGLVPVDMFWSPDGIAPVPGGGIGLRTYLIDSGVAPLAGWAIFLTLVTSFTCMTVGLFTGPAVVICFVGSVFQRHWNQLPLNAGHTMLVAVLFCLVWADCGSRLSLDAWRKRGGSPAVAPLQRVWPLQLLRTQVAVVYMSSGVFKLFGEAWRNGSALHYAVAGNVYGRIFHALPFPAGFDWTLTLLTYCTLFWELAFPLMLLHRTTRIVALAAGVAFHLGIWATLEVGASVW
jgi:Vitamin K-dependent gamma-carboxylase